MKILEALDNLTRPKNDHIIEAEFTEYSLFYVFHVSHEGDTSIKRVKCPWKKRADTMRALLYWNYNIHKIEELKV